ncbi:hypothetical protein G4B88_005322 [Cannabis sativa]|uniref:FAS1 domain-containing protein n=1 Tax=Cannabis sativa TaxID=3483 RepID=A0A7J6HAN1_CANSA|nr:hypothetical protein G4B88_005322 [Cannabis sativa]
MAKNQILFTYSCAIVFLFLFHDCENTLTLAQSSSPAQSPSTTPNKNHRPSSDSSAQSPDQPLVEAPPTAKSRRKGQPTNITEILEKAGSFSIFIRLLTSTDVISPVENDLNSSNTVTILAPTNAGFSALKTGTLNTLTPQQKTQLVQFHIIPTFISLQNFQTLTNPVHTQATNTRDYPLNITSTDGSSVNISTGVVNTTISGTIYSDNQLAIYRVDSVLLPIKLFAPKKVVSSLAPSPAPAMALKPKKKSTESASSSGSPSSSSKPSLTSTSPTSSSSSNDDESVATSADTSGAKRPVVVVATVSIGLLALFL